MRYFYAILAIVLFLIINHFGYQDAVNADKQYCTDVESGKFPDYKKQFDQLCKGD